MIARKQQKIEVEGATVEDAIKKALELLIVSREEINVKIVSEEQKGLFGMEGAKPAKIIVSVKHGKPKA
jgi:spoIIIJ-associated protein